MNLKWRLALGLAGLFGFVTYIVATCFVVIWFNISEQEQNTLYRLFYNQINVIVFFTTVLLFGMWGILHRMFKIYAQTTRLQEETRLIMTANPGHRIASSSVPDARELADTINIFADRYQDLQSNVDARIRDASASLEKEKEILAALMSELSQGVIVCNVEGQLLLYNNQARQLLSQTPDPALNGAASGFVGLGRSVFALMDRDLISHNLDNLYHRVEQGQSNPVSHFVTTTRYGQFIRAHMAPIQDQQEEISGFVLTMEDTTQRVENSSRRDVLLQTLIEGTRASLANIRAAIETILEYPDMDRTQFSSFTTIIREESLALSTKIEEVTAHSSKYLRTKWPLDDMLGSDLIAFLQRKVEQRLGMRTTSDVIEESLWLKVDSFSLVQALIYIISQLRDHCAVREVTFNLLRAGRYVQFDLIWDDPPIDSEVLRAWEQQPAITQGEGSPLSLHEVMDRHEGEVWCQVDKATQRPYMRLIFPMIAPKASVHLPIIPESRPEFYDFDLFHQPGQKPELDQRRLIDLTYTVFDTETTGLSPSDGDEIISIGAVRIVNGRLLKHEAFEQLIDPRRSLSPESMRIHGILPRMLKGQPTIEQVLPRFYQFTEDTVLVAHNAAFDMRFLQIKEGRTGIAFTQPVLDTLLLSAVVHPTEESHSLESIAEKLGINIIGRHTSLGDAIVTGEVFLKLIKLLAERGIVTLKDAREASQQTYYARLEY